MLLSTRAGGLLKYLLISDVNDVEARQRVSWMNGKVVRTKESYSSAKGRD